MQTIPKPTVTVVGGDASAAHHERRPAGRTPAGRRSALAAIMFILVAVLGPFAPSSASAASDPPASMARLILLKPANPNYSTATMSRDLFLKAGCYYSHEDIGPNYSLYSTTNFNSCVQVNAAGNYTFSCSIQPTSAGYYVTFCKVSKPGFSAQWKSTPLYVDNTGMSNSVPADHDWIWQGIISLSRIS